jgi:hypothetical protein
MGRAEVVLVANCLFENLPMNVQCDFDRSKSASSVGYKFAQGLPSKILSPLYNKCFEISNLGQGAETKEVIEKRIAVLQEQLKKLNVPSNGSDPTKNFQTAGSTSPGS